MQWFSRFFALYLLILCCIPCSDGTHSHATEEANARTPFSFTAAGQPDSHTDCQDVCSPFCSCQCCTTVYTFRAHPAVRWQAVTPPATTQVFPPHTIPAGEGALSIDHPPQLFS